MHNTYSVRSAGDGLWDDSLNGGKGDWAKSRKTGKPLNKFRGQGGKNRDSSIAANANNANPRLIHNPKHHPNARGKASVAPRNVEELFNRSIIDEKGFRWAKDSDGVIHRFSKPSNGEVHWNDSTAGSHGIRLEDIPNYIRKQLK